MDWLWTSVWKLLFAIYTSARPVICGKNGQNGHKRTCRLGNSNDWRYFQDVKSILLAMARQNGLLKLTGTLGDFCFYRLGNKFVVRRKGVVDKRRVQNDPAFQRTRENASEFGRACTAGKLFRTAFRPLILRASDKVLTQRLAKEMLKVAQADVYSNRGLRSVQTGATRMLEGFEFNSEAPLRAVFRVHPVVSISRESGLATIQIPAFEPKEKLVAPAGATHFRMISGAAEIDFEGGKYEYRASESELMRVNGEFTQELVLENRLPAASLFHLFVVFGIVFYQVVNGKGYPLQSVKGNCLAVVGVSPRG